MHNVPTQGVIQATWSSTKTLARLFLALLGLPRLPRREPRAEPCDIEQQRISWLSRGGLGYLSFICHESLEKQQISSRTMNSWTMISKGESHCNSGPFSIPVTKRKNLQEYSFINRYLLCANWTNKWMWNNYYVVVFMIEDTIDIESANIPWILHI